MAKISLFSSLIDNVKFNCMTIALTNCMSANSREWSNTLKQFVGNSQQFFWVRLTILWGWCLKGWWYFDNSGQMPSFPVLTSWHTYEQSHQRGDQNGRISTYESGHIWKKKTLLKLKSQVKDQLHSNRFADILTI